MLNELRELSIGLEKAGIEVKDLHPNFKACPKYLSYWVYLDEHGNVADIAPIPAAQVQRIRKWEKANGVSFPAFNMPPLFKAAFEEIQEQIKGFRKCIEKGVAISSEELTATVDACEIFWDEEKINKKGNAKKLFIEKLTDCLTKPIGDISGYLNAPPDNYKAITQLISRTHLIKIDTFKEQLAGKLLQDIHDAPAIDLIDALFFYSGKKPTNFQIVLDLFDRDLFDYPANHQEVQRWMNTRFMAATSKDNRSDLDAFGCNASGKNEKFPPVRLPVLGNVILRAMNQESPCQTRYGMIDHYSFPAGEAARKGMKSALEWLGREDRKGKTWCDLSRRMERPMLLFAYPSLISDEPPELAGLLGESEDEETENKTALFVELAEKVTSSLRGRTKEAEDAEIRVFVLAKMDKARTKVLASSRYSAGHTIKAAQAWQEGCRNILHILMRRFGKAKGEEPYWAEPLIPFPAEVVWCLNTVWIRQGTFAEAAHGFSINDALSLLLDEGRIMKQLAERALNILIRNSSPLFMAVGQANTCGLVHVIDKKCWKYSKQPSLLPSIFGLLLHKLGHTKGEIMTSPAFMVGRLLSIADSLHLEYCRHVRNNSIPPQLVGNALMATAQEEPTKALSMMWGRIKPYHAWAQTLKSGDGVGLVKYFLKQLGDVSDQLKDTALPQRCTDADKAQMLLGYLARPKSEES